MSPRSTPSLVQHFVDLYLRGRWIWLAVALVVAAIAWPAARSVKFDRSVERMFASDDPLLAPYERLKTQFGGNEVVLAVYPDDELLHADGRGLQRVARLTEQLKAVDGVKDVLSLSQISGLLEKLNAAQQLGNLLNLGQKPKWTGPAILDPNNPVAQNFLDLFEGYTHGRDGKTAALACMLEPPRPGQPLDARRRDRTIAALREIIENLPDGLKGGVLAGEPVMVVEGFDLLEKDGQRLWLWSTIMLAITVVVCFYSLRWLVAPLAVVNWALLLTQATLVWSRLELTMVSSMLSAIVTVVGVASVVHLIVRCRELEATGVDYFSAFRLSIITLAIPIAGAIATDVGGFGSLWSAKVGPVQDFGTMMFIGSLMVVPAITLLLPAISLAGVKVPLGPTTDVLPSTTTSVHASWLDARLHDGLTSLLRFLRARQVASAIVISLLAAMVALGALRLQIETDFTRNFRSDSRVVRWYEFVETRLGGAGVWDIILPAPRQLDNEYLARVRKLEERLRAIEFPAAGDQPARPGLTKVISLVGALDAAKPRGVLAAIPVPVEARAQAMQAVMPAFMGALRYTPDDPLGQSKLRIMLRARERQSAEDKRWLIERVRAIAIEEFPPANNDPTSGAEVTGFFVLLTSLIESMLRDQWTTFAVATVAMGAIMLVLFRSIKLALIGIVPNAVPIFLVMGLLGWLGLRINMGAAMIAAVSMGLSVDSSIHYIDTFLHARRNGLSIDAALHEVQSTVGKAMIFTTLTLDLGFLVLCTSEFVPTIYFGALVSLAMIGGLAGNLIILPLLIGWFMREKGAVPNGQEQVNK